MDFKYEVTVVPVSTAAGWAGRLVEFGPTETLFHRPRDERTEAYLSGKFG